MVVRRVHGHVRPVQPLVQHDVREDLDPNAVLAQPDEQVTVLGVAIRGVETADGLEDGSPQSGPASSPLESVQITVDGDSITQA